jgi:hypothetical protein
MGEKHNAGENAPPLTGGIVNAIMGKHAYSEEGKDSSGNTVKGYGHDSKEANADYQRKGGKT